MSRAKPQPRADLFTFTLGEKRIPSCGKVRRARENAAKLSDFGEFDRFVIQEAKAACLRRERMTGYAGAMDHMVPLARGGKHAWHNLQVIPEALNQWKGTRAVLTQPGEWVAMLPGGRACLFSMGAKS